MFGRKKILKHGVFFREGRIKTDCRCGCAYQSKPNDVEIFNEVRFDGREITVFRTRCPECMNVNKQYKCDLEKKTDE